jgi:hypothetical protein
LHDRNASITKISGAGTFKSIIHAAFIKAEGMGICQINAWKGPRKRSKVERWRRRVASSSR